MKQTAVDILYKFLYEMESFEGFDPYSFNQKDVFKKAKEMEREQIVDAYITSHISMMSAEQYYYETFKQQEQ
jgi:hypothetical protein